MPSTVATVQTPEVTCGHASSEPTVFFACSHTRSLVARVDVYEKTVVCLLFSYQLIHILLFLPFGYVEHTIHVLET